MCSVSTPKPDQAAVDAANKKPQYLRNPWLDGLSIQGAGEATGRNSLVIAPGTAPPSVTVPPTTPPIFNTPNTNLGIGSGGGFVGGGGGGGIGINRPGTGIKML